LSSNRNDIAVRKTGEVTQVLVSTGAGLFQAAAKELPLAVV